MFPVHLASLSALVLALIATAACSRNQPSPPAASSAVSTPLRASDSQPVHDAAHPLEIAVTNEGFVPARAKVKVGEPVTLGVTRKVERTCATDIVIKDYGINEPLPQGQRVEVTFTPKAPGSIRYACAMDMVSGELVAE